MWYFLIGLCNCSDSVHFSIGLCNCSEQCVTQSNFYTIQSKNWIVTEQLTVLNSYTIQSKNTTLTEQLYNPIKKYHTVWTVSNRKIPHCQNSYTIQSKNTTLLNIYTIQSKNCVTVLTEQWYLPHWITQSNRKITVLNQCDRTVTQSNRKIPHRLNCVHNPIKIYHTDRTVTQFNKKIPHWQNSYTIQSENTTLTEQLHNSIKKYRTDRTVTQSNRIPHWIV